MITPKNSFPVYIVKDVAITESFYKECFGFNVVFSNDWYVHLVSESGIQIGFMLFGHPTQPAMFQQAYCGEGAILSLEVDDVDASYSEAQSKSLNIALEIKSEDWGQRHFCIIDPNGVQLDIVQNIEPTGEYQSGYESE